MHIDLAFNILNCVYLWTKAMKKLTRNLIEEDSSQCLKILVRIASYGPQIDQSHGENRLSHIIIQDSRVHNLFIYDKFAFHLYICIFIWFRLLPIFYNVVIGSMPALLSLWFCTVLYLQHSGETGIYSFYLNNHSW